MSILSSITNANSYQCDLQEPNCERCRQSGRVCEGYKRGAVFLNRTALGLEKRKRLEEAQPRQLTSPLSLSPQSSNTSDQGTDHAKRDRETDDTVYPLVLPLTAVNVMKKKFQGLFLEDYLPVRPNDGPGLYRDWLCEVVALNRPDQVLEYSLHALCITRSGRIHGDQDLVVQGSVAYGYALKELQKALVFPRSATKDETLAACYILSIYEVCFSRLTGGRTLTLSQLFESTSQSIVGHENHLLGVERLVQFRGPRQHETPMGEALLKNICYSSV